MAGAGVAGFGALITTHPQVITLARLGRGRQILIAYGLLAARRAWRPTGLTPSQAGPSRLAAVLLTCLAFTFLNHHVYLDTVVLIGALSNEHPDGPLGFSASGRPWPARCWCHHLGFGAGPLRGLFARPTAWRILNSLIAVTMIALGVTVASRLAPG